MNFFSSRSRQCFFEESINVLSEDAFPISEELHQALLQGQTDGKLIDFSTEPPSLIDPPAPSFEQLAARERTWRDGELATTDRIIARHRDEREMQQSTTLADEQFSALQIYRRKLREWPLGVEFPEAGHRPVAPPWLAEITQ